MQEGPKQKKTWLKVLVAVLVVVLVAAAGAGLRWWQNREEARTIQNVIADAQDRALRGNTDEAQTAVDEALQREGLTNDEKYNLYNEQASIYLAKQEDDKAQESFMLALQYKKTDDVYQGLATLAIRKKDNEQAIKYYQEALKYIDENGPNAEALKKQIQLSIDSLQGKPLPGVPEDFQTP